MTDQEILVKKRQAAFTICKKINRSHRKLIDEVWGGLKEMTDYVLWYGEQLIGDRLNVEEYNEHQIINYLCRAYRTAFKRAVNEYKKNTLSKCASLEKLLVRFDDGKEKDLTELGIEHGFELLDENNDCKNIVVEVREILENEAKSSPRKANCVDHFEKLMKANWSATGAAEMFGGSKSLWNQRARSVLTDVADIIREKYPDYVESYAQLCGDRRGSSQGHVALTKKNIEGKRIHLRRKDETTKLYFIIKIRMLRYLSEKGGYSCSPVIAKALGNTDETIRAKGKSLAKEGLVDITSFLNENNRKAYQFRINEKGLEYLKGYENVK